MQITDAILELAQRAYDNEAYDAQETAYEPALRKAIAAVAPLIAQEAAKEIEALVTEQQWFEQRHVQQADCILAQAKEIAELRAALAKYGRHTLMCEIDDGAEKCTCGLDIALGKAAS